MPLMDDAVVYYCDEDDDEITVKYGVEDDLDDVADFYKDHFDDNDITLDDETDKSTRYAAEGACKDFTFKLRATEPSDEYAKQVFATVVKIEIVFVDEPAEPTPAPEIALDEQLPGFWQQESYNDGTGEVYTAEYGIAYEFIADGVLNIYANFEFLGAGSWSLLDAGTVSLIALDGSQAEAGAVVEQRDGKEYLIWTDSTGVLVFCRESKHTFMLNAPDPDEELAAALADTTWYYVHYSDENGDIQSNSTGSVIYYSNGAVEDTFDDDDNTGTWHVSNDRLYCEYTDGSTPNWVAEVETEGDIRYMRLYSDSHPPAYWLYSDQPAGNTGTTDTPVTYTSDADIERYIIDTNWHEYYYIYADGTLEEMTVNALYFRSDGTLDDTYDGEYMAATWYVDNGYLYITYEEDTEAYMYPAYIAHDAAANVKYLYMGDLMEGFEGCNWVFTDSE